MCRTLRPSHPPSFDDQKIFGEVYKSYSPHYAVFCTPLLLPQISSSVPILESPRAPCILPLMLEAKFHTQPIGNNGQNYTRSSVDFNHHVLRQQRGEVGFWTEWQ